MNRDELLDLVNELTQEVGDILNDNPSEAVHMVVARFFVDLSMESNNNKENFMDLCSTLWDASLEEIAEELKH
jgi:uncharacterized hydantoinase/oxoprolinase family protein